MLRPIQFGTISISYQNWLPYAAGCLSSLVKRGFSSRVMLNTPQSDGTMPSIWDPKGSPVLGLTNYVWNQNINVTVSKEFKRRYKNGILIWGGPNIPIASSEQKEYAKKFEFVDFFFSGSSESLFQDFFEGILQNQSEPQNCFGVDFNNIGKGAVANNSILSNPYLDGIFDQIFETGGNLRTSFETNRGCPYSCSYCDWGGQAKSRIYQRSYDETTETLKYLFGQKSLVELEILDANFGMFKRDLEIIEYLVSLKSKLNSSPKISFSGLAKNGSPYLSEICYLASKYLNSNVRHVKVSFQSHSVKALEIAGRANVKNHRLEEMVDELKQKDVPLTSEMIIGLPGETSQSWIETIEKDCRMGIDYMRAYILNCLVNTKLSDDQYLSKYEIKVKTIRLDYNLKKVNRLEYYTGDVQDRIQSDDLNEVYSVPYSCTSYNPKELEKIYDYWWLYNNLYNSHVMRGTLKKMSQIEGVIPLFFDHLLKSISQHSLLSECLKKHRTMISELFSAKEETYIERFDYYNFVNGAMRLDEVLIFWKNQEKLFSELDTLIKNFDNQYCENFKQDKKYWDPYVDLQDEKRVQCYLGQAAKISNGEQLWI